MYRLFKGNILLSRRSKKNKRSTVAVDKPKIKETPTDDGPQTAAEKVVEADPPSIQEEVKTHDKQDIFRPKETTEEHYLPIRLTRSLSRDSFSTFTTAAETPSESGGSSLSRSVVIWGDLPMPAEIFIYGGNKELGCGELMRQTPLRPTITGPLDACEGDRKESEDDDDEDEDDAKRCFLPKNMIPGDKIFRVHPSKSKYHDTQMGPSRRPRSNSIGDDSDYLRAPERWTRFEI